MAHKNGHLARVAVGEHVTAHYFPTSGTEAKNKQYHQHMSIKLVSSMMILEETSLMHESNLLRGMSCEFFLFIVSSFSSAFRVTKPGTYCVYKINFNSDHTIELYCYY